jgi:aminocarboxymuconate-semialdehyde decarboxylase
VKVDAYSHILPPQYFQRMQDFVTDRGALRRWLELPALHDVDSRLRMMDEFGPDFQQVLTLSSPPIELLAGPGDAAELAKLANDEMRELCERYPERFPDFVAALPLNAPDAALVEIERAVDELGARGIQVFTNVNGTPLDDPRFLPIFDEMARRDLPIWMHPTRGANTPDYRTETSSKYEIWWAFGWPYETSAAMARMVFSGLFDRHPGLKVITHHMGAMIPFLEGRIGLGWGDQLGSRTPPEQVNALGPVLQRSPLDYFRMFYADTALSGSRIGTKCGLDFFGVDHVVFASDCPFDPEGGPLFIREMIKVIDDLDLTADERAQIYAGNLHRLMGVGSGH